MSSSFQVWQTILTVLVWASMVGEGGEKIPPFSTRVKPPLEASEEQIKEALRARVNYSTPFRVACAAGMASLTYIRDSFGRVLSEGSGSSPSSTSDISKKASRSDNKIVASYKKRGNAEDYIKEAKYDMAVGHLLLKSFWANEAVFQMMRLSYNLFLLFKFDSLHISEYSQLIKTFRLKYVFPAGKIIRTARYVVIKLSPKFLTS